MKKTLSMLLAGAMLAAALTGCGSSASTGSGSADSSIDSSASGAAFKLGGTGPLTGANAIYGNACKNGAQIAVDEINAEGGDIQFELNYQDDEGDAEKAVNAYNTLKDWGMQLSLGSVTSKPCEATAAETYSRPYLRPDSRPLPPPATTEGKDNHVPDVLHGPRRRVLRLPHSRSQRRSSAPRSLSSGRTMTFTPPVSTTSS